MSRLLIAFAAASALAPAASATDRFFRDLRAASPSGRYRVAAVSPDNAEPGYHPFQVRFTYACTDARTGETLWTRQQAMGEPDPEYGFRLPEEPSPVALFVSDGGVTVIRTGSDDLIVVSRGGRDVGTVDLLEEAFTAEERERHVHPTTAGPMWSGLSHWYFLDRPAGAGAGDGVRGGGLFVVRPYWGRRAFVDLAIGSLAPPTGALKRAAAVRERGLVIAGLNAKADGKAGGEGRWTRYRAAHLAGVLKIREAAPALRALERSDYRGSSTSGGASAGETFAADEVDPHSYQTYTLRQVAQLSLRRLGEAPRPLPCHLFETGDGRPASPNPGPSRVRGAGSVRAGMAAARVLELLGSPDFVTRDAWSYDIDGDAPFSLTLTFDARAVTAAKREPPLWKSGPSRDGALAH